MLPNRAYLLGRLALALALAFSFWAREFQLPFSPELADLVLHGFRLIEAVMCSQVLERRVEFLYAN